MRYFRNYEYIIYITGIYLIVVGFYKKKKNKYLYVYKMSILFFSDIILVDKIDNLT